LDGEPVKKSMAYTMTAVLLGAVLMIVPWASSDNQSSFFNPVDGSEGQYAQDGGTPKTTVFGGLTNPLSFVGLMLAVSLVLASGVYLFSKKRISL
jgi:ABC-type molybdate transport system permease subunit